MSQDITEAPNLARWDGRRDNGHALGSNLDDRLGQPLQAALDGVDAHWVIGELCETYAGQIAVNPINIFDDVVEAEPLAFRIHEHGPGQSAFATVLFAQAH